MRREEAKKILDEPIIRVGYLLSVLFEKGKHYTVQKRFGSGLEGVTGECESVDEHMVVIKSSEFAGFDKPPINHWHHIKTEEIAFMWEVENP